VNSERELERRSVVAHKEVGGGGGQPRRSSLVLLVSVKREGHHLSGLPVCLLLLPAAVAARPDRPRVLGKATRYHVLPRRCARGTQARKQIPPPLKRTRPEKTLTFHRGPLMEATIILLEVRDGSFDLSTCLQNRLLVGPQASFFFSQAAKERAHFPLHEKSRSKGARRDILSSANDGGISRVNNVGRRSLSIMHAREAGREKAAAGSLEKERCSVQVVKYRDNSLPIVRG